MKKISLVIILSFILFNCVTAHHSASPFVNYTFEDVSDPFLEKYGKPTDVQSYSAHKYRSITWTWKNKLSVKFVDTLYDAYYGWTVDSIYWH